MDPRLLQLLGPAYLRVPAQGANEAIARERLRSGDDSRPLRSYELVLTTFEAFTRDLLPKLVYHLESIGAHLPQAGGVLIAAFLGEQLYFLEAHDFIASACELMGLTPEALVILHGTGESRTAITLPDERN
ncbi:MAG TPA: STAUR_1299 family protein [Myxococcales bacterium]|nr:STAUR_1299 family protein [Myxococcales bacterium]